MSKVTKLAVPVAGAKLAKAAPSGAVKVAAKAAAPLAGAKLAKKVLAPDGRSVKEQVTPMFETVAEQLGHARERVVPALEHAVEQVGPTIELARERLTPAVETAREQFHDTVAPAVTEFVELALERSGPIRDEALRRGELALAALMGEPVAVGRRRRWPVAMLFLFAGVGAGAALGYLTRKPPLETYQPPMPSPPPPPPPPPMATGGAGAAPGTQQV